MVELHLKLFRRLAEPRFVLECEVPVLTTSLADVVTPAWDLTTQRILPHIDGVNYLLRIATVTDIDVHLVRECIQNLMYDAGPRGGHSRAAQVRNSWARAGPLRTARDCRRATGTTVRCSSSTSFRCEWGRWGTVRRRSW